MFGGYAGVWYRDFPKYCVQDTEKIRTQEKEDSSSKVLNSTHVQVLGPKKD